MSRFPSDSQLERVDVCPASAPGIYPHVDRLSEAGLLGTSKHGYLSHPGTEEEALAVVPEEHRAACAAIDWATLGVDRRAGAAEVTLAYDIATGRGREVGRMLKRKYEVADTESHGTADWVALVGDDALAILDWKSGQKAVTPAARNWQLRALALAACRAYGRSRALVAIVYVREGDAPIWDGWRELDAYELGIIAGELAELAVRIEKVRADPQRRVTTGSHCHHCPAVHSCPATGGFLARVASESPEKIAADVKQLLCLTPEHARRAYERRRQMGEVLAIVDAALKSYAAEHPIDLGPGKAYGPVEVAKRELNGMTALRVLSERYGPDVARECVALVECSQASIGRGLKPVVEQRKAMWEAEKAEWARRREEMGEAERDDDVLAPKPSAAGLLKEAMSAIEAAGGVERRETIQIREHAVRDDENANG